MPMSRIRYTLDERVEDPRAWAFSWSILDDVTFSSTCDFCGQAEQRLTYEVFRESLVLHICQRCVGRYPVGGTIAGEVLDLPSVRAHIHGLTARQKQRTCQEAIRMVQAALPDCSLSEVVVYFERNLQLSPLHAAALFSAMAQVPEPIDVRIFEVQTRSIAHQAEFGSLGDAERAVVWPALTPQQKRRLAALGHAPAMAGNRRRRERELPGSRMTALTEPARFHAGPKSAVKSTT